MAEQLRAAVVRKQLPGELVRGLAARDGGRERLVEVRHADLAQRGLVAGGEGLGELLVQGLGGRHDGGGLELRAGPFPELGHRLELEAGEDHEVLGELLEAGDEVWVVGLRGAGEGEGDEGACRPVVVSWGM